MSTGIKVGNLEELRDLVDRNEGILTTTMEVLRDAYGKGRLGIHVRDGIRKSLAGLGMGHFPLELPKDLDEPIRLYRIGTPVGDLIEAVLEVAPDGDGHLRRAAAGDETSIIQQIRELVCS